MHIPQNVKFVFRFFWGRDSPPLGQGLIHEVLNHTQRRTTVSRTLLDEWSACRRDLYLTTHNTHNRQTSMPPVGFEPTVSAGKRQQTYTLDRAATGIGCIWMVPGSKLVGTLHSFSSNAPNTCHHTKFSNTTATSLQILSNPSFTSHCSIGAV